MRPFPKNTHCPKNTQCKFALTVLHTPSAGRSGQSRPSPSPTAARGAAHGPPLTAHAAARASAASPRQPGTATSPSAEKRPRLRDAAETFSHLQRSVDTGSAYLLGQLLLPTEQHPRPCRKRGIPLASGAARSPLAAPRGDAFRGGDAFQEGSCGLQNLMETHCKPQTPPIPAGLTWAVVSKDKISGRTTPAAVSHVRAARLWHPPPPRSGGPHQPHCPAQARAHREGAWKPVASARTPPWAEAPGSGGTGTALRQRAPKPQQETLLPLLPADLAPASPTRRRSCKHARCGRRVTSGTKPPTATHSGDSGGHPRGALGFCAQSPPGVGTSARSGQGNTGQKPKRKLRELPSPNLLRRYQPCASLHCSFSDSHTKKPQYLLEIVRGKEKESQKLGQR